MAKKLTAGRMPKLAGTPMPTPKSNLLGTTKGLITPPTQPGKPQGQAKQLLSTPMLGLNQQPRPLPVVQRTRSGGRGK